MLSAGQLIWISCRPLLRLIICAGCGFAITKADIFPAVAARGTGQILLNITLPSLMFSKIVPAFTSQNISKLGPLVLVALIYEGMGILQAWLVSRFFWVPHRFRWGILVAGGWGNYGDIPTAVIMSITGASPFNGAADQTLSVAYIAGFILVYMITFFPLGGSRMIGFDYVGPDVEADEVREATRRRRKAIFFEWPKRMAGLLRSRRSSPSPTLGEKKALDCEEGAMEPGSQPHRPILALKHVSFDPVVSLPHPDGWHSRLASPAPTATAVDTIDAMNPNYSRPSSPKLHHTTPDPPITPWAARRRALKSHLRTFLRNIMVPGSISIIISFIVALIPNLKALFVSGVPGTHIPNAPDGDPPLAFIMDALTFIGAASVPMGLICLGSALARLSIPRGAWRTLPSGAILSLAACKMLLSPVLGVLICHGLIHVNVISKDDKVLQFVCIFFSCLPTATTQVFVTQVYSGTGSAEHLSAFLIPQYILMFPAMTGLTAYTLQALF